MDSGPTRSRSHSVDRLPDSGRGLRLTVRETKDTETAGRAQAEKQSRSSVRSDTDAPQPPWDPRNRVGRRYRSSDGDDEDGMSTGLRLPKVEEQEVEVVEGVVRRARVPRRVPLRPSLSSGPSLHPPQTCLRRGRYGRLEGVELRTRPSGCPGAPDPDGVVGTRSATLRPI